MDMTEGYTDEKGKELVRLCNAFISKEIDDPESYFIKCAERADYRINHNIVVPSIIDLTFDALIAFANGVSLERMSEILDGYKNLTFDMSFERLYVTGRLYAALSVFIDDGAKIRKMLCEHMASIANISEAATEMGAIIATGLEIGLEHGVLDAQYVKDKRDIFFGLFADCERHVNSYRTGALLELSSFEDQLVIGAVYTYFLDTANEKYNAPEDKLINMHVEFDKLLSEVVELVAGNDGVDSSLDNLSSSAVDFLEGIDDKLKKGLT